MPILRRHQQLPPMLVQREANTDQLCGGGEEVNDMSATCPEVRVQGNSVLITPDWYDPQGERIYVEAYDLDAFIDSISAARDKLRQAGSLTAWSRDADGAGNCGPIPSLAKGLDKR